MSDKALTAREQNTIDAARALAGVHGKTGIDIWLDQTHPGFRDVDHDSPTEDFFDTYLSAFIKSQRMIKELLEIIDRPSAQLAGQDALFTVEA